jgi:hypothetical protein
LVLYPQGTFFDAPRRTPATVTLPVPWPRGTAIPQESFLAYRLQGLEAQRTHNVRVVGINPNEFPAFFWQAVFRGDPLTYACRISRERDQGPILRLAVQPRPPRREGTLRVAWRLGAEYADVQATLDLKAADGDLALVEWDTPASVEVTAVRGPELRELGGWSWAPRPGGGGRVQAWLRSGFNRAHLELTGSMIGRRLPDPGTGPGPGAKGPLVEFNLSAVRVLGMERNPPATVVQVTTEPGLELAVRDVKNLAPQVGAAPSQHHLVYSVRRPGQDYGGRFAVAPARLPTAKVFTIMEVENRQLKFHTRIEASAAQGRTLRSLGLRLDGWPGTNVMLSANGPTIERVASGPKVEGRTPRAEWEVDWEHKGPAVAVLTLSGQVPVEEVLDARGEVGRSGLPVPDLHVSGVSSVTRWLATGKGTARFQLSPSPVTAVARRSVPPFRPVSERQSRSALPDELTRPVRRAGGKVWRLAAAGRRLQLLEEGGPSPPVQVVLREHVAAILDQQRWLHQTTWWLYHDAPAELVFTLPEGVQVLGVTVDGVATDLPPASRANSPSTREAVLPLTLTLALGGSGARRVCLRWSYQSEKEDLSHPILKGPQLREEHGPCLWTLHVPPGFRWASGAFRAGPRAAAGLEVQRAVAQHRLTRLLLESTPGRLNPKAAGRLEAQLAACLQRFALHCRNADHLLLSVADADNLTTQVRQLRRDNRTLIDQHGLGELRRQAERRRQGPADQDQDTGGNIEALAMSGRPLYWMEGEQKGEQKDEGQKASTRRESERALSLTLVATADLERRRALAASGLLAGLLLAVWLLSSFPKFVRLAHLFWPEQVAVLGLLGWQTFGPTWPVVFLVALGVVGRILFLASVFVSLLRRRRVPEPHRA